MTPANTASQSPLIKVDPPKRRRHLPHLLGWLFGGFAVLTLVVMMIPVTSSCGRIGPQTRALVQAKQAGLALRLFAGDHDGVYPRRGIPKEMTVTPADSNVAFACLFPTYVQSETIFGNKLSAYQSAVPDNVIDPVYTGSPKETLQPGENVLSYVMGLTDGDNPSTPLVADGTDGMGFYNSNPSAWGGVWKGSRAIIVRLDNSAAVETLTGPSDARFVAVRATGGNLLDFSHSGKDIRLLDPAIGPRRR